MPSNSLNSHKNGDDHGSCSEMYAVQSTRSASNKVSSVIKVVQTERMKEFLVWPDTPKRKGEKTDGKATICHNIKQIPRNV
jgi:hypothetical protein